MTAFRLVGLAADTFQPFFAMDDQALAATSVRRVVADSSPGYPCRVTLEDAQVGETLLLLSYEHLSEMSPYRAGGPIFVREGARRAELAPGDLPPYITRRLMSVRAYDARHMMVDAEVCAGEGVREPIERLLGNEAVAYLHLHNAKRGCFFARVERVG
ncbi:MAG: DUF1203 domain-containing protein [Betaproteobacteria bacterium]